MPVLQTNQSPQRKALITGATSGIGRATALQLARDGFEILVHGRDAARGAETVVAIEADGGKATFIAAVLGNVDQVKRLAEQAGEVEVLVNNGGSPRSGYDARAAWQAVGIPQRAVQR
jgi:NAD(P)-dependent dehydrogenase (short-subunit alcohol dehydrogenase family)